MSDMKKRLMDLLQNIGAKPDDEGGKPVRLIMAPEQLMSAAVSTTAALGSGEKVIIAGSVAGCGCKHIDIELEDEIFRLDAFEAMAVCPHIIGAAGLALEHRDKIKEIVATLSVYAAALMVHRMTAENGHDDIPSTIIDGRNALLDTLNSSVAKQAERTDVGDEKMVEAVKVYFDSLGKGALSLSEEAIKLAASATAFLGLGMGLGLLDEDYKVLPSEPTGDTKSPKYAALFVLRQDGSVTVVNAGPLGVGHFEKLAKDLEDFLIDTGSYNKSHTVPLNVLRATFSILDGKQVGEGSVLATTLIDQFAKAASMSLTGMVKDVMEARAGSAIH